MATHPTPPKRIEIRGAKVHNLKNLDVDIPLYQVVGIAGVSGSGKSFTAKREMVGLALAAENGDGGVPDDIIVIDPESEVRHEVAQQIA